MTLVSPTARPSRTTWLRRLLPGLSSTGFIAASAGTPAAAACIAWARPISAPSGATIELFDMFCALNGATRTPCRASQRQIPAVMTDLPASDVVPATSSEPLVVGTVPLPSQAVGGDAIGGRCAAPGSHSKETIAAADGTASLNRYLARQRRLEPVPTRWSHLQVIRIYRYALRIR